MPFFYARLAASRSLLVLALGCASLAGGLSGKAAEADDLDRRWLKLETPGLVIISNLSEAKVLRYYEEIERFRQGLRLTLRVAGEGKEQPGVIYLFSSDSALKPFLPLENGKPQRIAAYFTQVAGQNIGVTGLGGSRFESRQRLYHEITHWYLEKAGVILPLWLEEGLAQVYEEFVVTGGKMRIGNHPTYAFDQTRVKGRTSLQDLFATETLDYSAASFHHGKTNLFYARSATLTHMLMFSGAGSAGRISLYIDALRSGQEPVRAFENVFGLTLAGASAAMDDYVSRTRSRLIILPLDREKIAVPRVTPLDESERDVRMAALLIAGGHLRLAGEVLTRAMARTPENPRVWELHAEWLRNTSADAGIAATNALLKAYQLGSRNAVTCGLLGYAATDGVLPPEVSANALTFFREALRERPAYPFALVGLAYLALSQRNPDAEVSQMLLERLPLMRDEPIMTIAVAHTELAAGHYNEARSRLRGFIDSHPAMSLEKRTLIDELLRKAHPLALDSVQEPDAKELLDLKSLR